MQNPSYHKLYRDAAKEKGRGQEEGRQEGRIEQRADGHRWTSGLGDVQGTARRTRQKTAGGGENIRFRFENRYWPEGLRFKNF